jgi:hypothetical protein
MLQRTVFINRFRMLQRTVFINKIRMLQRTNVTTNDVTTNRFINKFRMLQRTNITTNDATMSSLSVNSECYSERILQRTMLQRTVCINKFSMLHRTVFITKLRMLQRTVFINEFRMLQGTNVTTNSFYQIQDATTDEYYNKRCYNEQIYEIQDAATNADV